MIVLAVVLLGVIDASAASEVVDGVAWTYSVSDGMASVYKSSSSPAIPVATTGALTVPSTLGGYPVTSIGDSAFYKCSGLTSVTILDGVTSIGDEAFRGCRALRDVYFKGMLPPNAGHGAFTDCDGDIVFHAPKGWRGESHYAGHRVLVEGEER